jgi:hypothetical protein
MAESLIPLLSSWTFWLATLFVATIGHFGARWLVSASDYSLGKWDARSAKARAIHKRRVDAAMRFPIVREHFELTIATDRWQTLLCFALFIVFMVIVLTIQLSKTLVLTGGGGALFSSKASQVVIALSGISGLVLWLIAVTRLFRVYSLSKVLNEARAGMINEEMGSDESTALGL